MPFERFTDVRSRYTPSVSITRGGMISFNQGSVKRFDLESYAHAVLFFDQEARMVGVRLTNDPDEEGAAKLRHRRGGADVSAKSFLEYWQIEYRERAKKYVPERREDDDLIVFSVD